MKFGIRLGALNPKLWIAATEAADKLGYHAVWLPEHLVIPSVASGSPREGEDHPPVPSDVPCFDVFVYIAALAMRTTRVRFATGVYNIGLRHPFVVARAVATADVLSNGRVDFGIGSSWLKEEWDAVGLDFHSRGRRVDEAIEVCTRLWHDREVEHHGEFFSFAKTAFEPKPVQKPLPLVIGGDAPASLRRAAQYGAAWYPLNTPLADLPKSIEKLAALRSQAGHKDRVEVVTHFPVGEPADVERYAAAGIDQLIVSPWKKSKEALDGLKRFAEQYIH
jgi:probable F420-dependent oxidoreductase